MLFPTLLFVAVFSFLIRWFLNWNILNEIKQTNYTIMRRPRSINEYLGMFSHMVYSEWLLYWRNTENSKKKLIANILSLITVLSTISLVLVKILDE